MNLSPSEIRSLLTLGGIVVGWLGLGIVMARLYASRPGNNPPWLWSSAFTFFGPLLFPCWLLVGGILRQRRENCSVVEGIRSQLTGKQSGRLEPISVPDDGFVIYDTNGESLVAKRGGSDRTAIGIRLTHQFVGDAVAQKASDILIHPTDGDNFSVRYRVNGTLRNWNEITDAEGKSVVNCIKALSGMDIAERRRPQDGGFTAKAPHGKVSFRVATAGVLNGEKVSVRILDQSASTFNLESVGLSNQEITSIQRALTVSQGMILVCGPTGSGKSSTVHAMLQTIDRVQRNVITIEDPIEYVLPNASQIEINTKAGLTFANALRSVLRQDPDVISVGEIRDSETANIALQAAQTGHLVFATVHSGSNLAALMRLEDLGCDRSLIASAVNVVISQRLVRTLCEHCKRRATYSDAEKAMLWKQAIDPDALFGPNGCGHCHKLGYSSRTGVFDIMVLDTDLRGRFAKGELRVESEVVAAPTKMSAMQIRATQMALAGITSWEEVQKLVTTSD